MPDPSAALAPDDADRFLVAQIRASDPRAWNQLIQRYHGRLSAFARARLGRDADVDDAVQEAFIGFLTSLPHYDESRPLETYLFSILRYKIGDVLTRRKRPAELGRGFDAGDESDSDAALADPRGESPSRSAMKRELSAAQDGLLAEILRRFIAESRDRNKLDDVQVIELLFFVGLRNKEAADRLGRDEKSVAGVKFRCLSRLREFLEEIRAQRGPQAVLDDDALSSDAVVCRVWRTHRLTCLKRSTIGSYLLGVLDEPWQSFTRYHLEEVRCLMCQANLEDLSAESADAAPAADHERVFQSSIGFLSRASGA
ncbi:MAG: sigma-70 family RNA polymerase sigma factor [Phycisphaerae bacterium]